MPLKESIPIALKLIIIDDYNKKDTSMRKIAGKSHFKLFFGIYYFSKQDKHGISHSSVSRIIRDYKNGIIAKPLTKRGPQPLLSDRQVRCLKAKVRQDPSASSSELSNYLAESGLRRLAASSIRRYLNKIGLRSYKARNKPFLTCKMMRNRKKWCKERLDLSAEYWRTVLFSDESMFTINLSSVMNRVRRYSYQDSLMPNLVRKTQKFPIKIMVWGCFHYNGVGRIRVIEGSMNSEKYIDTLERFCLPSMQEMPGTAEKYLIDDSAPCHRSKRVMDYKNQKNISCIDWPGNSPDLNPIENLWGIIKRKLSRKVIKNKKELIEALLNAWKDFNPLTLQKLVD